MEGKTRKASPRKKRANTAPAAAPSLTLDDAVTLLMQIEPADLSGFDRFRSALTSLVNSNSLPTRAHEHVSAAIHHVDRLLQGEPLDGEEVLFELSRLLEAASEAGEAPTPAMVPKDAAPVIPAQEPANSPAAHSQADPTAAANPLGCPADGGVDPLPPDADRDLLAEFITESQEYIEGAEAALLSLETDPENQESVNSVFRAFHTIKGTSGFLGLKRVSELAHRAESILSRVRDREIQCTGVYADLALRSIDMLKGLMHSVHGALNGNPMIRPEGYDALLRDLASPETAAAGNRQEMPPRPADILVAGGKAKREEVEEVGGDQGAESLGLALVKSKVATLQDVSGALRSQKQLAATDSGSDSSLRVRTDRLNRLIDVVGELVIAQSMVAQDKTLLKDNLHELLRKVTHAGKIVRELQDLSMSMRMVPLRATFQKMHRLVRDVARKSGKDVNLITEDGDTEIDRHMVDIINDLLVHMVRNAVDHGIESPEERTKNGKDRAGTVRLTAFHAGGNVVVEIRDDGKGLDREKIIRKAIGAGLISSEKGMSDSEVYNLIFAPGLSTAETVTDVSGRGVGMDVVRKGVESLHGRIDVATVPGQGSTFSVRLPLTLAITDGMLVKVGPERYIVPTGNIHLCFRPGQDQLSTVGGRGEMVLLRGELMPIFRLHQLFMISGAIETPTLGLLVVVGDGERRCALLVDELLGQQQFVAKSLGDGIGKVQGVSGGAILGDGRVGLILDPAEIAAMARQGIAGREESRSLNMPAA